MRPNCGPLPETAGAPIAGFAGAQNDGPSHVVKERVFGVTRLAIAHRTTRHTTAERWHFGNEIVVPTPVRQLEARHCQNHGMSLDGRAVAATTEAGACCSGSASLIPTRLDRARLLRRLVSRWCDAGLNVLLSNGAAQPCHLRGYYAEH